MEYSRVTDQMNPVNGCHGEYMVNLITCTEETLIASISLHYDLPTVGTSAMKIRLRELATLQSNEHVCLHMWSLTLLTCMWIPLMTAN